MQKVKIEIFANLDVSGQNNIFLNFTEFYFLNSILSANSVRLFGLLALQSSILFFHQG